MISEVEPLSESPINRRLSQWVLIYAACLIPLQALHILRHFQDAIDPGPTFRAILYVGVMFHHYWYWLVPVLLAVLFWPFRRLPTKPVQSDAVMKRGLQIVALLSVILAWIVYAVLVTAGESHGITTFSMLVDIHVPVASVFSISVALIVMGPKTLRSIPYVLPASTFLVFTYFVMFSFVASSSFWT